MDLKGMSSASLLVAVAGLALASPASGIILNWATASSGPASLATRWTPTQVPTNTDDLVFNCTAGVQSYTVTFDAAVNTSRSIAVRQDNVTLSMSSTHNTTNGVAIADLAGDVATATLSSGGWSSGPLGSVNVGDAFNSTGTFNVTGTNTTFVVLGNSDLFVGNNGTGTLNINGSGTVTCNDSMSVGQGSSANATLTVSGASAIPPFGRSTLAVLGTNESRWGNGGDATVSVANGALAQFAGDLILANLSTSVANITVGGTSGPAGLLNATLDVGSNLSIARNTAPGTSPGSGTLAVNAGGEVRVAGTLHIGNDPDGGGSGTLQINNGALVHATSVALGAAGNINHAGGTLRINGGTYSGFALPLSVSSSATLSFANNAAQTLTPSGGVSLRVGTGTSTGNLRVESGADLDAGNGDINLGDGIGSTGNATVTGAGSRLLANSVNSDIRVGFNGEGNLTVESGGQGLFRNLLVPNPTASADGFVNVTGLGSNITTQFLAVGQASGGSGAVQVQSDGSLTVTDPGFSTNIRSTGTLVVAGSGAVFSTPGTVTVSDGGRLAVGGTVSGAALVDVSGRLDSAASTINEARVNAPVRIRAGGDLNVVTENLRLGSATSPDGVIFDSGSTVTVGAGFTLSLDDASNIDADGRIVLQGGTIRPFPGRFLFMDGTAADQLSGEGTIDGNIVLNDLGAVAPSGTGLIFTGTTDLGNAVDIDGTALRFTSGSTMRDFGSGHTFNCRVIADAGAAWQPNTISGRFHTQAFGPITIGDGSTAGATINGVIHMGTNGSLTFNDANGVALGTLTDMNGGTMTSVNGLRVDSGRVLRGNGSINVSSPTGTGLFLPAGTIDPDAYNASADTYEGIGHFSVDGNFSLQTAGTYLCDLAGFDNEFRPLNDRITCTGRVFLSGSTLVVSLINGYVPSQCDTFTILTGASFSGQFATVIKPRNVVVVYNPNSVQLLVSGCLADMDDGSFTGSPDCGVTIDDLLYFLFVFEAGTLEADVDDGSFTGTRDDGVTIDDLLYFLFRFEQGC